MKPNRKLRALIITALCVALGMALPQLLHFIPFVGQVFLPMHIPVLLCGLLCGGVWGLACGLLTPLLSAVLFSMPPMAILPGMMLELALYGLAAGLLYRYWRQNIYLSLIGAMLLGRIAYGLLEAALFLGGGSEYSFGIFFSALFVKALPGIVIQIVLIPLLVLALEKTGVAPKPRAKAKSTVSGS